MESFEKNKGIGVILAVIMIACVFACGIFVGAVYLFADVDSGKVSISEEVTLLDASAISWDEEAATLVNTITVNGYAIEIDVTADSFTWFESLQMTSEVANKIQLGDFPEHAVYIEGELLENGAGMLLELDKLGKGIGIEVILVSKEDGAMTNYYIRTLPTAYDVEVSGEAYNDGYYYITQTGDLYKLNGQGEVVFFRANDVFEVNFRAHMIDGELYYSFAQGRKDSDYTVATGVGATLSRYYIMNENYEIIDEVSALSTDMGMPEDHPLDHHEFVMLDLGHYIVIGYVNTEVDNVPEEIIAGGSSCVVDAVIQELKDGELLFQWNSVDYPELYGYSNFIEYYGNEQYPYVDYMHINGVDVDPSDNNLICSFREINAVMKLDRETGEILWILGGAGDQFGQTAEESSSYQHFARVTEDGDITIFDNGNAFGQTRALEYTIDEETMTITEYNAHQIDGAYSYARGSTMELDDENNIYLMGWGVRPQDGAIFTVVNYNTGEVYFEAYSLSGAACYRAYTFDY